MTNPISSRIDLKGQTAIVTGAAKGIGAATAVALAREGANVVVSDILPLDHTISKIKKYGQKVIGVHCDITKPDQVNELIETAIESFEEIHILVANAGIIDRTPLLDISLEGWNRVIDINLTGMFLTVQAVYRHMKDKGSGKIVCIGSVAGKVGGVISAPNYVASKGGVHAFVKSVAKEAAPIGINVNAVAPGPCNTEMNDSIEFNHEKIIPLRRMGAPEDIAEAAVFLASQASNYITGQILNVNGGILME